MSAYFKQRNVYTRIIPTKENLRFYSFQMAKAFLTTIVKLIRSELKHLSNFLKIK